MSRNKKSDEATCRAGVRAALASRLKRLRIASGHPLKRIAFELEIPLSTLSAWENGTRFPSAESLERIAKWHGIRPCQLLNPDCSRHDGK